MTNRDYANRNPARKGKAKTTRRKQAPAPKGFPLVLLLVTLTLLGGFGYFLWSINNSADDTEQTEASKVEQTDKSVKSKPKKDPNALPPAPKEEWTYQHELENKKVEIDLPEEVKPTRPYQMQCGSFRKESQANEMKAVIAFQGLEAQVRKVKGTSGYWYKVVLGPYERKRAAEKHRHTLQRGGLNGCLIWFWEGS
ncbi:SPOR domain-containing protein [Shewanella eurypsychrophilus]|uniref:SPOR domain-containing protein n=1 Tax=Shewanella eurypsychrophilus TaxID=2593656 RepID=A0ABX8S325_9GAMM|nr:MULTISPECIES: SPOR domain-containing protein [Shewanella]QFU24665.1 sporulation protein [Shewanella sp. YLB-09]QXP44931.1 SPOR domain-containing protein [Shewanella eurypsychrophilus]